jgi:hypothetical protein
VRFISMIRGLMIGLIVGAGMVSGLASADALAADGVTGTSNTTFTTDDTPWD